MSVSQPSPMSSRDVVKTEVADIIKNDIKREESEELAPSRVQLQELFKDVPIETMERGIEKGLSLTEDLKQAFSKAESKESEAWLAQIEKISKQAQYQKTVIGVVGNTGAGKSSIINALLDEERLVYVSSFGCKSYADNHPLGPRTACELALLWLRKFHTMPRPIIHIVLRLSSSP
jgi:ribosome biogenesis GTPase A